MARVWLAEEIIPILQSSVERLQAARKLLTDTEKAVMRAVNANQTPAEVNAIGDDGYRAAGVLIAHVRELLSVLRATEAGGMRFPRIAALGSPHDFTRVHVDDQLFEYDPPPGSELYDQQVDSTAFFAVDLSRNAADAIPNPWEQLAYDGNFDGIMVKVMSSLVLNLKKSAADDTQHDIRGYVLECHDQQLAAAESEETARETLELRHTVKYGEASQGDCSGVDVDSNFILRTVDDGETDTYPISALSTPLETDALGDNTIAITAHIDLDIIGVSYIPPAEPLDALADDFVFSITNGDGSVEFIPETVVSSGLTATFIPALPETQVQKGQYVVFTVSAGGDTQQGYFSLIYRPTGGATL